MRNIVIVIVSLFFISSLAANQSLDQVCAYLNDPATPVDVRNVMLETLTPVLIPSSHAPATEHDLVEYLSIHNPEVCAAYLELRAPELQRTLGRISRLALQKKMYEAKQNQQKRAEKQRKQSLHIHARELERGAHHTQTQEMRSHKKTLLASAREREKRRLYNLEKAQRKQKERRERLQANSRKEEERLAQQQERKERERILREQREKLNKQ